MSGMREAYRIIQDIRQDGFPLTGTKTSKQRKAAKPRPGSRGKVHRGNLGASPAKKSRTEIVTQSNERPGGDIKEEPPSPVQQDDAMDINTSTEVKQEISPVPENAKDSTMTTQDEPLTQETSPENISIPEANQNGTLSHDITQENLSSHETSHDSILETSQDDSTIHNSSMDADLDNSQDASMYLLDTSQGSCDNSLDTSVKDNDIRESTQPDNAEGYQMEHSNDKENASESENTDKCETSVTVIDNNETAQIKDSISNDSKKSEFVKEAEKGELCLTAESENLTKENENDLTTENGGSSEVKLETGDIRVLVNEKQEKLKDVENRKEIEKEELGKEELGDIESEYLTEKEESNTAIQMENDNIGPDDPEIRESNNTDTLQLTDGVKTCTAKDNACDLTSESQDNHHDTSRESDEKCDTVEAKMIDDGKKQSGNEDGCLLNETNDTTEVDKNSENRMDGIVE